MAMYTRSVIVYRLGLLSMVSRCFFLSDIYTIHLYSINGKTEYVQGGGDVHTKRIGGEDIEISLMIFI